MNQVMTLMGLGLLSAAGVSSGEATGPTPEARHLRPVPTVEIWANRDVYRRGDRAHAWFRTDYDAYVTVFQIDTDGRIRVLYPHQPWYNNFVPGGRRFEIWDPHYAHASYAFHVDDYPGQGYLLAVASTEPFDYSVLTWDDRWDYRAVAYNGRIVGDPYVALMDVIDHIVPYSEDADYTYDVYSYHVNRRYDYPRFLCYDCHGYKAYYHWDPYRHSCVRFRVVIYDDHYYYPIRHYRSTRVVYVKPRRIEARYVFKERTKRDPYVTHVRERPVTRTIAEPTGRRVVTNDRSTAERTRRRVVTDDRPTAESTGRRLVTDDRSTAERLRSSGREPAVRSDQQRRTVTVDRDDQRRSVEPAVPRIDERSSERRTVRREIDPAPADLRTKPRLERREVGRSDSSMAGRSSSLRRESGSVLPSPAQAKPTVRGKRETPQAQSSTARQRPPPKRRDAKKPEARKRKGKGN